MLPEQYDIIVIGGGHAGVEAAWAAANLLPGKQTVGLVTLDPSKIGVMSCNPAIGGLAKGQIVREIDAMGGVMGLATDATGIQFKVLNASKGPAVHGPRAQCDKHAYALAIQALIASRSEIQIISGSVERLLIDKGAIQGVVVARSQTNAVADSVTLRARAVVLTTGTFMRGLMHTGESKVPGGRFGEKAAVGISAALRDLGFELGRLKTGTPPRLKRDTINWDSLQPAPGDEQPVPFSDLSGILSTSDVSVGVFGSESRGSAFDSSVVPSLFRFPVLPQVVCAITTTNQAAHEAIRANLHRAPMYTGQIESVGPRYCPSIEDKVVRFADKLSHQVFLEPESLTDDWIYCNGISTSLPADVQDKIVRSLPGCEKAHVYRYGYAVEYDMVKPHQIHASTMTKLVEGLFLAGQINGTSGYEEAAGQGLLAGINAARYARAESLMILGREQAYIGVMLDDLVTKTPTEPYRMFTSRAEHRLLLRSDNAADRLTPLAIELGLLNSTPMGLLRKQLFSVRRELLVQLDQIIETSRVAAGEFAGMFARDAVRRQEFTIEHLRELAHLHNVDGIADGTLTTALADRQYATYIERQHAEVRRQEGLEKRRIHPAVFNERSLSHLRTEARHALIRFKPETFGQAGRLEGITPADLTLLSVLIRKHFDEAGNQS